MAEPDLDIMSKHLQGRGHFEHFVVSSSIPSKFSTSFNYVVILHEPYLFNINPETLIVLETKLINIHLKKKKKLSGQFYDRTIQ